MSTTPLITIFVRHSADCKYHGDETCKRCDCKKHLRWFKDGKQHTKTAGSRTWAGAEEAKRSLEDQFSGRAPVDEPVNIQTIRTAYDSFLADKEVQGITADSLGKYKLELGRFVTFCEDRRVYTFAALTMPTLIAYRQTFPALYPSTYTRAFVQRRLTTFLRFCFEAKYLDRVPKLAPIKIDEPPTLPLTEKEYKALLAAAEGKTRACIQLMRWSGLAVRDASLLRRDELRHEGRVYRVVTDRQKTGTSVSVPIPPDIAKEVLAVANGNPTYIFWVEKGSEVGSSHRMGVNIREAFDKAGIRSEGHMISHRLRDTFAVDLLEKGVPLEEVSKLLGHTSISTTEKHYAKWVKGRQDRLDGLVMGTWQA